MSLDISLLTDCENPEPLFASRDWCVEEKLDGDRCILIKKGNHVAAFTRNGNTCSFSEETLALAMLSDFDFILDGELMKGGHFIAFDVISTYGIDVASPNEMRRGILKELPMPIVRRATTEKEKLALCETIRKEKGEGIVFKHRLAPYVAGRTTLIQRLKNYETDTFEVVSVDLAKCSFGVKMNGIVFGNVAASLNTLPKVGDTVRIRYDKITEKGKLLRARIAKV